jgi:hypothetical protein
MRRKRVPAQTSMILHNSSFPPVRSSTHRLRNGAARSRGNDIIVDFRGEV